jgi:hypothetical protein
MDKDYSFGFSLTHGEFLIYNEDKNILAYQIKSRHADNEENVEIIEYPSEKVVGKFKRLKIAKVREVIIEVLDNQTQRWGMGKLIYRSLDWVKYKSDIE